MSKSRYNIAHILPSPVIGGTEHGPLRIMQATTGVEFHHTAFHLEEADAVREMFTGAGFETAAYQAVEPSYRHPQAFLRASFQLARQLRRRKINLVHCADVPAAHYTAVAGRLAGLPVLCHVRNRYEEISRRDRSFLLPVTKFVFVSHDTWQRFVYPVPARRGVVVYDGIDTGDAPNGEDAKRDVRHEFGIPQNTKIIGMAARVAPQKDYATLARAAERIIATDKDICFMIVGDYSGNEIHREHYAEVQRVLDACGVTPYFVFTGFRQDTPRLLAAMDIFVLSTHWEGLPLVILEAMAQAKPVVATAVDGIPEIVIHNQTGLLYKHQDDEELALQLRTLLDDEPRAATLGEAGRRFVETNFNQHQFAASMIDLYRGMLGEKRQQQMPSHKIKEAVSRTESN